jgi:segregation and condensation protein B
MPGPGPGPGPGGGLGAEPPAGPEVPPSPAIEYLTDGAPVVDHLKAKIEALLFTSAIPLKLAELMQLLERPRPIILKGLRDLVVDYATRDSALAVAKQGQGYSIVLRNDYQDVASLLMPPELEPAALKTLSVIAVNQPVAQARLVELRGSTAYEHVKALVEKGMVRRRKDGNTFILRTTKLFATRFRVEDDPERIREAMAQLERRSIELAAGRAVPSESYAEIGRAELEAPGADESLAGTATDEPDLQGSGGASEPSEPTVPASTTSEPSS